MVESMSLHWKCSNEIKIAQPYQISELPPEPEQPAPAAPPAPASHPEQGSALSSVMAAEE